MKKRLQGVEIQQPVDHLIMVINTYKYIETIDNFNTKGGGRDIILVIYIIDKGAPKARSIDMTQHGTPHKVSKDEAE